jgi:hypothetical protein
VPTLFRKSRNGRLNVAYVRVYVNY